MMHSICIVYICIQFLLNTYIYISHAIACTVRGVPLAETDPGGLLVRTLLTLLYSLSKLPKINFLKI